MKQLEEEFLLYYSNFLWEQFRCRFKTSVLFSREVRSCILWQPRGKRNEHGLSFLLAKRTTEAPPVALPWAHKASLCKPPVTCNMQANVEARFSCAVTCANYLDATVHVQQTNTTWVLRRFEVTPKRLCLQGVTYLPTLITT